MGDSAFCCGGEGGGIEAGSERRSSHGRIKFDMFRDQQGSHCGWGAVGEGEERRLEDSPGHTI